MDKSESQFGGTGTGTGISMSGSLQRSLREPSESGSLNVTGISGLGIGDTSVLMENLQPKNEQILSHKTKVSEVKPPERIVYEWEWDIVKFDKAFPLQMTGNNGKVKVLKSEKIRAGADIGRKSDWIFVLSEANGKLSWYIQLEKTRKGKGLPVWIYTAYTFKVVDASGKELFQKYREFQNFREGYKFGWNDLMELEKLYDQKDIYLTENTLRIRVLFEMFVEVDQSQLEAEKQDKDNFAKLMTNDMCRLRSATGTADVHLECEGKLFAAHKLILSARSGAFLKMFGQPATTQSQLQGYPTATAGGDNPPEGEKTVTQFSITEVESNILEIILDYIYSGNFKPLTNPHILSGVIRASDKFELNDLKSYCFNALMNFLAEENAGNFAVLAFRHNAEKNVRANINSFCLRHLTNLMKKKSFRDSLKMEPDAFFPDDECM